MHMLMRIPIMSNSWIYALFFAALMPVGSAAAQGTRPINVESTPPGATVYLDAVTSAPLGVTPLRNVRVSRGNHILIVQIDGHEESRLPILVRRSRETFRVTLNPLATFVVSAGNAAAEGARVRVDGESSGVIPARIQVIGGRYLVEVDREGYQPFRQWLRVEAGQLLTLPVLLQREEVQTGSILVAPDVSGAVVFLDGEPRGTTPVVIDDVPVGEHRIEIRPEGQRAHVAQVMVRAGQRSRVAPTLQEAVTTGSIRALANVASAIIRVDGDAVGPAPATREGLSAGEHIVEATAEGYLAARQRVVVVAGREHVVSLELVPEPSQPGRIVVNADADNATVYIDGEDAGLAPVVVSEASPGVHAIAIQSAGYREFRTTCRVGPGVDCRVDAELTPIGSPVRVEANVTSARLFVDGEELGPIPWEGTIAPGSHRLEVRAEGFESHAEQIRLAAQDETRLFNIALNAEGVMAPEERERIADEAQERREDAVSHSAAPLPGDLTVLDMSVGWPYLAELRFGVGILDLLHGDAGLVGGFAIRTFGRLTEFEGRAHFGYRPIRQVSVGAQLRLGGGLGPARDATEQEIMAPGDDAEGHPTNTFFMSLEALGSLHFSSAGAFSLWLAVDMYTDRWDWEGGDSDALFDGAGERQSQTRLRLGGSLEVVLTRSWNAWATFEGIIVGPTATRRILGDVLNTGAEDTELYGRIGVTYKFGARRRGEAEDEPTDADGGEPIDAQP